jgi:hypothetical protein
MSVCRVKNDSKLRRGGRRRRRCGVGVSGTRTRDISFHLICGLGEVGPRRGRPCERDAHGIAHLPWVGRDSGTGKGWQGVV